MGGKGVPSDVEFPFTLLSPNEKILPPFAMARPFVLPVTVVVPMRTVAPEPFASTPRFDEQDISTVALESGFSDISYFNRCFRRRFGATPTEVRERTR